MTANTDWQLTVAGDGDFADGTGETFPLSRLEWRVNGSGATFAPFATAGAFVSSGAATPVTGTATPLDLRLQVTYQDSISPVPFQTGLTYIATTP